MYDVYLYLRKSITSNINGIVSCNNLVMTRRISKLREKNLKIISKLREKNKSQLQENILIFEGRKSRNC